MFKVIIFLVFLSSLYAQCPTPDVFSKLDVTKYVGKWHEIQRFKFVLEETLRCVTAEYTIIDSSHVKVNNSGYEVPSGKFNAQIGQASIPDSTQPSKLIVQFFGFVDAPYWVIDTDYTSYSLIYSCSSYFGVNLEYAWIISRNLTLDDSLVTTLKNKLASYKIDVTKFEKSDQSNCTAT